MIEPLLLAKIVPKAELEPLIVPELVMLAMPALIVVALVPETVPALVRFTVPEVPIASLLTPVIFPPVRLLTVIVAPPLIANAPWMVPEFEVMSILPLAENIPMPPVPVFEMVPVLEFDTVTVPDPCEKIPNPELPDDVMVPELVKLESPLATEKPWVPVLEIVPAFVTMAPTAASAPFDPPEIVAPLRLSIVNMPTVDATPTAPPVIEPKLVTLMLAALMPAILVPTMLEVLRLLLTIRLEPPRIPWSVPLTAPELLRVSLFRILNPFPPAPVPETVAAVWTLIVRLSSVPVPKAVPTAVVVPLHVTTAPLVVQAAQALDALRAVANATTQINETGKPPPARLGPLIFST
jgi:hypothetical protein